MESQLIRAMSKSAGKPPSGGVFELHGKSKDLRAAAHPGFLIQQFKEEGHPDQAVARAEVCSRSELANEVSSYLFSYLHRYKIPTHFIAKDGGDWMVVRQLAMYPLLIRVWNTAVGTLARRLGMKEGLDLSFPVIEHYYKAGEPPHPLVNDFHLFSLGVVAPEELRTINRLASKSNAVLRSLFARRGLKLFSVTFEFGVAERQIMLGDELTPRTCFVGDGQPRPRRTREAGGGNGRPPAEPYRLMRDRLLGIPAGRTQA
jgi:phosphoribosylaminoimidazole-succinocarboxamide synthase